VGTLATYTRLWAILYSDIVRRMLPRQLRVRRSKSPSGSLPDFLRVVQSSVCASDVDLHLCWMSGCHRRPSVAPLMTAISKFLQDPIGVRKLQSRKYTLVSRSRRGRI
jgi:hypothetical protein